MKRLTHIFGWLVLSLILFGSCEEYYEPIIKITPEMLVVESRLTNNPKQNFVRLSITRDIDIFPDNGNTIVRPNFWESY